MENHFCCEQQFLFFFFSPLLAKVFEIRGGGEEEEREQPGPSGQVAFSERLCPFPCTTGMAGGAVPDLLCPHPSGLLLLHGKCP